MSRAAQVFAALAALLHVSFFVMESVLFSRPDVQARFQIEGGASPQLLLFAFNQGFYNLFLAAGCAAGLVLARRRPAEGRALVLYTCSFMVGAGLVLVASAPELAGAAAVQAGPPLLAVLAATLGARAKTSP